MSIFGYEWCWCDEADEDDDERAYDIVSVGWCIDDAVDWIGACMSAARFFCACEGVCWACEGVCKACAGFCRACGKYDADGA